MALRWAPVIGGGFESGVSSPNLDLIYNEGLTASIKARPKSYIQAADTSRLNVEAERCDYA
jgi:hypothetical protein